MAEGFDESGIVGGRGGGGAVRAQEQVALEDLGCLGEPHLGTIRGGPYDEGIASDLLDGVARRGGAEGGAGLARKGDAALDDLSRDEEPRCVVNRDDRRIGRFDAGADGVLAVLAAGNDGRDLCHAPFTDERLHAAHTFGRGHDDDAVDVVAALECGERPGDERAARDFGVHLVDAAHALAAAGGDDNGANGAFDCHGAILRGAAGEGEAEGGKHHGYLASRHLSYATAMMLLIDGNNLAWAGYYGLERAMKPEDDARRRRVALLGLASMVLGTIARGGAPPATALRGDPSRGETGVALTGVALCFDEGRPIRRRGIYAPYQTGREHDLKFMANEMTILEAIAEFSAMAARVLPIDVVRGKNTEADDLIAGLVHRYAHRAKRIVSTDRDFMQLVGPMTSIYAPVKKLIVTEENFFEAISLKGRFPRDRFLDYRALTGDPSDNLPGVPSIGEVTASKMLAAHPLDAYLADPSLAPAALGRKSEALVRTLADPETRVIVERNRTLMDLRLPAPCWEQLDELTTRGTWDRPAFEAWFDGERISAVERTSLLGAMEALAGGG